MLRHMLKPFLKALLPYLACVLGLKWPYLQIQRMFLMLTYYLYWLVDELMWREVHLPFCWHLDLPFW